MISFILISNSAKAQVEAAEIYCTIRETGSNLNCQWVGRDARKSMSADDIVQFIDKAEVVAYMSVKSRKNHERVFLIDADSLQFRKLSEVKKIGSISEISKAKNDLFAEIEKKAIKISEDLDAMNPSMDLVKYDASIGVDKYKRELRKLDNELVSLKEGASSNRSFENGGSGAEKAKWELLVGAGSITVAGLPTMTTSTLNAADVAGTSANLAFNYNWNERWWNQLEIISVLAADYGRSTAITRQKSNTNTNLKTFRNFGKWDAGLFVTSSNVVIANGNNTYSADQSAMYLGIGGAYTHMFGSWMVQPILSFNMGLTLPQAVAAAGTRSNATAATLTSLEVNVDKMFTQNHGLSLQLNYNSHAMTFPTAAVPTGKSSQTNTNTGLAVMYKYASF